MNAEIPPQCLVTYTWTIDLVDPVFAECPTETIALGCNPATFPDAAAVVIAAGDVSDECTLVSVVAVPADATGSDCLWTRVWTVTATDECGNTAECLVTYTWTIDLVDPVFAECPTDTIALGCNPPPSRMQQPS